MAPGVNDNYTLFTMHAVILGAGPAGMSCANALLSFGLEPVVIERAARVGGIQRGNFHPNLWMLGMPGETGREITERLAGHYQDLPLTTHLGAEVVAVTPSGDGFGMRLETPAGPAALQTPALVLATGMRPRSTPELERLRKTSPRVIVGPLSDAIRDSVRDGRVLILGGGDNALDHALFLAERGNRITVCARGVLSARRQFVESCAKQAGIDLRMACVPTRLIATADGITAVWPQVSEAYDWLLAMYGYLPNTDVLKAFAPEIRPRLTESGHVWVDSRHHTSVAGLYAAGDITECLQPSVPTAIAQGLATARSIERDQHSPSA